MTIPADKDEPASFLSRWSRRKVEAKAAPDAAPSTPQETAPLAGTGVASAPVANAAGVTGAETPEASSTVALPDLETLTNDGDFSPFMAKGVDAATRNQAMKKLFTDPHYGFDSMDKLDIYLDDYSKPDPIPLEMLRNLNQAKRLFLFDDEEKEAAAVRQTPPVPPASTGALTSETGAPGAGDDADASLPATGEASPPLK